MIKVTVTVPVYNTSNYLRRCLDSLKVQTMGDEIEFVIVDDGSTDGSGDICEEYARHDSRFRVIHQKNGGLASARQTGLNAANGEYVIVCDSDDWVEPDIYQKLYDKALETGADISVCGYFTEYSDGRSVPTQHWFKEDGEGFVDRNDFLMNGAGCSWVKLIRKSLFNKASANYTPGINLGEDALIIFKLMKGTPRIVQVAGNYYHYRRLFGQETYTNSLKMSHIHQLERMYAWLNENYSGKEYFELRQRRSVDIAFAYLRASDTDIDSMRHFLKKELMWSHLFKGEITIKKLVAYSEKILPLSISKYLLRLFYSKIYK